MRVGVVEAPPWVTHDGDAAGGVEADLVRRFADELGADVEWIWGREQDHLEALERFELDLVIGGLTQATPWRGRVGLTNPYFTDTLRIGVPPGTPPLRNLEGARVAVGPGSALAATLEERGAEPVPTDSLAGAGLPVAAPAWELQRWGFDQTEIELGQAHHVLAVPPGENGWLVRLETFLRHAPDVTAALTDEAPR